MEEIILTLNTNLSRDQELLLELRKRFKEMSEQLSEIQESMKQMRIEVSMVTPMPDGVEFTHFAEKKLKVSLEYSRRLVVLVGTFEENFSKMLYFSKRVHIQIAMARSQLKFQYDTLSDPNVMEMFSENIKLLVQLVKNLSEKVSQFQSNYVVACELMMQIRSMMEDLHAKLSRFRSQRVS